MFDRMNELLEDGLTFRRSSRSRNEDDDVYKHIHDHLEISVLQENEATYHLVNKDYHAKVGDVFLFRPFDPHWTSAKDKKKPFRRVLINFSPSIVRSIPQAYVLLVPFYAMGQTSPHIKGDSLHAQFIQKSTIEAITLQDTQPVGWRAIQFRHFLDILINISQYYIKHKELNNLSEFDMNIIQAIEYIVVNFTSEINMNKLIRASKKSKPKFYQAFKKLTGITPNEFKNKMRVQMAVDLLNHTDIAITEVAYECGYYSISNFNYQFNKHMGCSPREQRNASMQSKG